MEVVTRLNEGQMKILGMNGNEKQKEAVIATIAKNFAKRSVDEQEKLKLMVARMRREIGWAGASGMADLINKMKPGAAQQAPIIPPAAPKPPLKPPTGP